MIENIESMLSADQEFQDWFENKTFEEKIETINLEKESSCFVSATYDFTFECLRLVFKSNPQIFYDFHISEELWNEFKISNSKGKFYHLYIK